MVLNVPSPFCDCHSKSFQSLGNDIVFVSHINCNTKTLLLCRIQDCGIDNSAFCVCLEPWQDETVENGITSTVRISSFASRRMRSNVDPYHSHRGMVQLKDGTRNKDQLCGRPSLLQDCKHGSPWKDKYHKGSKLGEKLLGEGTCSYYYVKFMLSKLFFALRNRLWLEKNGQRARNACILAFWHG